MKHVELTEPEKVLLASVEFNPPLEKHDAKAVRACGEAAYALTISLLERKAIPKVRRRWFIDPSYNIGGHGASRRDIFERNGTRGEDILRHPPFLKYLHYFIYGPDLPAPVIQGFEEEIARCGRVSSSDIIPLGNYAKQQARAHELEPGAAAEEFFKLAVECGLDASDAASIRRAVKRSRTSK
jgi:hypothetical protein